MREMYGAFLTSFLCTYAIKGYAGTALGNLLVTATGAGACAIVVNPIAFGEYVSGTSAVVMQNANLIVNCVNGTPYVIKLSTGRSGSYSNRVMTSNSTGVLKYNIYVDPNYSTIWGDGSSLTSYLSGMGAATNTVYTVYAKIPAYQAVTSGAKYSDAVTVTVTY